MLCPPRRSRTPDARGRRPAPSLSAGRRPRARGFRRARIWKRSLAQRSTQCSRLTRPSLPLVEPDDVAGTGKPTRLQLAGELRHDVEAPGFGGS